MEEAVLVQASNYPVQKFSAGRVQASVWENNHLSKEGENRNYKNEKWKYRNSLLCSCWNGCIPACFGFTGFV